MLVQSPDGFFLIGHLANETDNQAERRDAPAAITLLACKRSAERGLAPLVNVTMPPRRRSPIPNAVLAAIDEACSQEPYARAIAQTPRSSQLVTPARTSLFG
jgi:hypothetical protein